MLFKPVYLKPKMREALIPMVVPPRPPSPPVVRPPTPPEPPQRDPTSPPPLPGRDVYDDDDDDDDEEEEHLPVLVNNYGIQIVYPSEARRDVLSGKVAYVYIDEKGVTVFKPKHIFTALKLRNDQRKKYENYPCIGAHQRVFEQSKSKSGRRRRNRSLLLDEEEEDSVLNSDEGRSFEMSSFSRGSPRPRA